MGGGDLNLKKSWHPHTMKNQEKVWKAEQAKNAEDRKMKDLRREILEEKNREDLVKIGQSSGVLAKTDDKKLEWMYKSSSELINREDYLLGRQIDRAFETMDAEERNKDLVGVKVPVNHVEHECIPFSIRSYRNATSNEQVDLQRKILEDPLMMIKQKEMESRRKILENPVKLKELHRILKIEKTTKSKSSKESKKNKKKKKKSKKKSSDSNDSSDDSDKDLDAMLQKQYNKLKDKDSKQLAGLDLTKLLDAKYKTISKELDKAVDSKKKKKKSKKKSKKSSSSNESQSDSDDDSRQDSRDKTDNRSYRNQRERSRSPLGRRDQRRDGDRHQGIERRNWNDEGRNGNYSSYNRSQRRSRSQSPSKKQVSRRRPRSQSPSRRQQFHRRSRSQSPSKRQQSHRRSRSQSPSRRQQSHRRSKSPVQTNQSQSSRSRENREDRTKKNQTQKERLTEEEKEKRLKDMMENAAWRDKERTRNVQKYRDGYNKEEQQNQAREFDKEFINTQLRKAMSTTSSVESRIKSNINNIQRTSAAMNANFARK